ncbi:MAG: hypothetical protein E6274_01455 [Clostridium sp.]|uniref:hypothetical protein n=1 Tax=Clostridium sp. TaxID=1506 RepID=UPI0029141B79|nr:hypothetical protein [Clostridium sp.]MDU7251003.1 hypothetical protein [Clostridium sp.]
MEKKFGIHTSFEIDEERIKIFNDIKEQVGELENNSLEEIEKKVTEENQRIRKNLERIILNSNLISRKDELIKIISKNNNSVFDHINFILILYGDLYPKVQELQNDLIGHNIIGKNDQEINNYLAIRGWFLSRKLDLSYIRQEIGKMENKEISVDVLDCLFESYFSEDNYIKIETIINNWNHKHFYKRNHIFEECLWGIKNNKQSLVLPALYSQLEGIVRDEIKKINRKDGIRGAIEKIFDIDKNGTNQAIKNLLIENIFSNFYKSTINDYWDDEVFKGNRNEILHGVNWDYGKPANSIKAVLILDSLHDILQNI